MSKSTALLTLLLVLALTASIFGCVAEKETPSPTPIASPTPTLTPTAHTYPDTHP